MRDSNEASWTQVLDVLEFMSDVTSVPILLDGDTGYGNFNNARRLVRKLEQRNIAECASKTNCSPKPILFWKAPDNNWLTWKSSQRRSELARIPLLIRLCSRGSKLSSLGRDSKKLSKELKLTGRQVPTLF